MDKRILLFIMATLLVAVGTLRAQSASTPAKFHTELGASFGTGSLNGSDYHFTSRDLNVSFGYAFTPRFSAYVPLTLTTGLFRGDSPGLHSTYENTGTVGVGAGWNAIQRSLWRLRINGEAGCSLNRKIDPWSYYYYDAGARLYLGEQNRFVNAYVGLGVKHMLTRTDGRSDYFTPYVSIGFRLNALGR
jgi:hypothetical protein